MLVTVGDFFTPIIAGIALLMCGDANPKDDIVGILKENQIALRKEFVDLKEFLRVRLSIQVGPEYTKDIDELIKADPDILKEGAE